MPDPWYQGRVVLIGDAAHATTPHLASGAGLAAEDGLVLARELQRHESVDAALRAFMARAHQRARTVVENSVRIGQMEMAGDTSNQATMMLGAPGGPSGPVLRRSDMAFALATARRPAHFWSSGNGRCRLPPGRTPEPAELLEDWDAVVSCTGALAADAERWRNAPLLSTMHWQRRISRARSSAPARIIASTSLASSWAMRRCADPRARGNEAQRRARAEQLMDERAKAQLPYCFIKLPACVIGPCDDVVLPRNVAKPDWELELGVVIGRRARHVKAADALGHVAGLCRRERCDGP